jgi:hypothetical protein
MANGVVMATSLEMVRTAFGITSITGGSIAQGTTDPFMVPGAMVGMVIPVVGTVIPAAATVIQVAGTVIPVAAIRVVGTVIPAAAIRVVGTVIPVAAIRVVGTVILVAATAIRVVDMVIPAVATVIPAAAMAIPGVGTVTPLAPARPGKPKDTEMESTGEGKMPAPEGIPAPTTRSISGTAIRPIAQDSLAVTGSVMASTVDMAGGIESTCRISDLSDHGEDVFRPRRHVRSPSRTLLDEDALSH